MTQGKYSRIVSTLLVLTLLIPSTAMAVEGDGSATEQPIQAVTTQAPVSDGWSFGESNPQPTPPRRGDLGQGRVAPSTTGALPVDDRLRRASGTTPVPPRVMEDIEQRENLSERIETGAVSADGKIRERIEGAKERLAEARAEQMKDFVRKTIARMRAAIERLTKLADRIDSRMVKIEQAQSAERAASSTNSGMGGGKVNVQDISLCLKCTSRAREEIEKAKAALVEAEAGFASYTPEASTSDVNTTETPTRAQPGMGKPSPMRESLKNAEMAIRAAHRALVESVSSMRPPTQDGEGSDSTQGQ